MNEKSQTSRRYDREFKENAVALVRGGRTISSVARDLGVTTWFQVFDYVEGFYNRTRLHSGLGYQSPLAFETNLRYSKN